MDVIWLDIEHTDGKRYFTWDNRKFPNPTRMLDHIESYGRKMITIIDPHIKVDNNYFVYKEGLNSGLSNWISGKESHYVKQGEVGSLTDFTGHCWPGESAWLDFLRADTRQFWIDLFKFDKYKGSTQALYTWNDMNEPSVFSGPEITMPKNLKHKRGEDDYVEHRDLHNIYGALYHSSTVLGQKHRVENKRPFVLTRAFYAGTQKFGAMWTGDNMAEFSHL